MAIAISGTLEPAGKFPLVEAPSIALPTGERLDALFDDDGKIKSDSLPSDVGGSDPRLDELLETMFDDGKIREEFLPDIEASDPRVDGLLEVVGDMIDEESGKINAEYLPEIEASDPRLDSILDDEGNILESALPEIEATDPRVDGLLAVAENLFDDNGKISEELLPEGIGGDSGGVTDTRLNDLLDGNGIVKTEKIPVATILQAVMGEVLDTEYKIKESYLPEDWVKGYVESYINEALGGEY